MPLLAGNFSSIAGALNGNQFDLKSSNIFQSHSVGCHRPSCKKLSWKKSETNVAFLLRKLPWRIPTQWDNTALPFFTHFCRTWRLQHLWQWRHFFSFFNLSMVSSVINHIRRHLNAATHNPASITALNSEFFLLVHVRNADQGLTKWSAALIGWCRTMKWTWPINGRRVQTESIGSWYRWHPTPGGSPSFIPAGLKVLLGGQKTRAPSNDSHQTFDRLLIRELNSWMLLLSSWNLPLSQRSTGSMDR